MEPSNAVGLLATIRERRERGWGREIERHQRIADRIMLLRAGIQDWFLAECLVDPRPWSGTTASSAPPRRCGRGGPASAAVRPLARAAV
ncbi:hypothetical protein ACFXC8_35805 [Streptomyces sp. NPDC059441]|uniref:hypothetical protein n=1 Tax=Streptomyces sp. NPDC059441 TaxID=3346829 RepID=UPI0036B16ED0